MSEALPEPGLGTSTAERFHWITFTLRIPTTLGLSGSQEHFVREPEPPDEQPEGWADAAAANIFGPYPIVKLRFYAVPLDGIQVVPTNLEHALHGFYGDSSANGSQKWPLWAQGESDVYEQWVTLETPSALARWDSPEYAGFAFERCVRALNIFLNGYSIGMGYSHAHGLNLEDIGPIVYHGERDLAGNWTPGGLMLLITELVQRPLPMQDSAVAVPAIRSGIEAFLHGHPFVQTKFWRSRAVRSQRRGDQQDRVISLQTSAESMLATTLRLTLVDRGLPDAAVRKQAEYESFKRLFTRVLPSLLGGDWNTDRRDTASGRYWVDLYNLRNRIVHAGYSPSRSEGDDADAAYLGLRDFLNRQIWASRKSFPRTMLAKLGQPEELGFVDGGRWLNDLRTQIQGEPLDTWWLPWDVARREPTAPGGSQHSSPGTRVRPN